jgi:MFS family permease
MFFVNVSNLVLFIAVVIVAFISGSSFVLAGQVAHEDYGDKHFGKILGIFMTAGALGLLIFDQLIFDQMYSWFSARDNLSGYKSYGKWSNAIFLVTIVSSGLAFVMALGGYIKTRKSDGNKDKIAEFVKF